MTNLSIESNGRIERTAVYIGNEQVGGIKELFLNIDEEGSFDGIIQYEGTDKKLYTKQIFNDYLGSLKIVEPMLSEEDAQQLHLLTVESDGDIENTVVFYDDEQLEGIVSLFVHIKPGKNKSGILSLLSNKGDPTEDPIFKAEITFRNEDDTFDTERLF